MARNVMVATPCYGGSLTANYVNSLLQTIGQAAEHDVNFYPNFQGDSLVTRARNNIAAVFLDNPELEYLFWIDADIGWEPEQFYRVLNLNRGVVCAAYPFKNLFPPEQPTNLVGADLIQSMMRYVMNRTDNNPIPEDGFAQVYDAATGFMCIHRSVFDVLKEAYPEEWYNPDMQGTKHLRNHWLFFDTLVQNRRYLSEDYAFCRKCQRAGIPVWMDMRSKLSHTGSFTFQGDLEKVYA